MNEKDHNLSLNLAGSPFEMTRDNAILFTFVGHLATRNHVFLTLTEQEDDETIRGTYIFAHHSAYPALASYMVEHEYPLRLNLREVAECDENVFQQSLDQISGSFDEEVGDSIPEDWLNDGK